MIYIVGQGPSGLMLAYMIKKMDPNVPLTLVDKENQNTQWHCTYGVWKKQIENTWLHQIFGDSLYKLSFDSIRINFMNNKYKKINLSYGFLNNSKIKKHLQKNISFRKKQWKKNDERFYVNCTGRKYNNNFNTTFGIQQFLGIEVELHNKIPEKFNTMTLMDYSLEFNNPSTFCYMFPLGSKKLFMEETSLMSTEYFDYKILIKRLKIRIQKMNLEVKSWKISEKDSIIMGGYMKDPQWFTGKCFGASAGMVERHSGYMLSVLIPLVPTMAELVLCKYYSRKIPKKITYRFKEYKKLDRFYHLGQKILLSMDHKQLNKFFYYFFQLPENEIFNFMNHKANMYFFLKPKLNNYKLLYYIGKCLV
jgi:hypothetical protein